MVVYWIRKRDHTDIMREGYVGIASDFDKRMISHHSAATTGRQHKICCAIRKHGWDSLIKEVIFIGTEKECRDMEKMLRPEILIGWNTAIGGDIGGGTGLRGRKQSKQHVTNKSKALTGRKATFRGKKHSVEAKKKIAAAQAGRSKSEECKQKNREAHQKPIKVNGVLYESIEIAGEVTGIGSHTIYRHLRKKPTRGKWMGYQIERA